MKKFFGVCWVILALLRTTSASSSLKSPGQGNCTDARLWDCGQGLCTRHEFVCDTIKNDCPLNVDERNCPGEKECNHPNQFQCADGAGCTSRKFVCDGVADCEDESDEDQACPTDCSGPNQFRCNKTEIGSPGWCVADELWCDGEDNCADDEDELHCPSFSY